MSQFIFSIDKSVSDFFISHASPALGTFAKAVTFFADMNTIIFVLAIIGVISLLKRNSNFVTAVTAVAVSSVVIDFLKNYVARLRPAQKLYGYVQYGYAFPSGHAFLAVVLYGLIGYWCARLCEKKWQKVLVSTLATLFVIFIGFSRIVLNVHWLSDVLESWILGGIMLFITIHFHLTTYGSKSHHQ